MRACAFLGRRRRARPRLRGQPPAVDDAAEEAAAAARSGGLKQRPAATGRRRNELGGRPRLGAVRGSGPGVGGGAAGGQRSFLAAAAVAMRGTAWLGPPRRGRLPGARGLRAPPPPLLLLFALLPLLPAPGAAAGPASRPPALPPAPAGPSVSLYLSEDEVRRLIGEWGRLRRGGQVGPGPGCFRPPSPRAVDRGPVRSQVPGALHAILAPEGAYGTRPLPTVLAGRCGPFPLPPRVSLLASPHNALAAPPRRDPGDPSAAAKRPEIYPIPSSIAFSALHSVP